MRISNDRRFKMELFLVAVLLASNPTAPAQPPDNAALLYYQAFLLHGEPDETTERMMSDFWISDGAVTAEIIQYVDKNRHVIDLVVKAAEISKCDWGYDYSQGMEMRIPHLSQLQHICFLLRAETRWLTNQRRFTTALDRCMTLRKIAVHACESRILVAWLSGNTINLRANGIIQDIMGLMPPDVGELERLKNRLTQTQARFPSLTSRLRQEAQNNAALIRKGKIRWLVDLLAGSLGGYSYEPMLKRIREGDDAFFDRNREYYLNCWATSIDTVESGLPYPEICSKLEDLRTQWSEQAEDNPDATITSLWYSGPPYAVAVRQKTHTNALKTAIDLYIVKARTGKLPGALPADSAPDLYSGKPFVYERIEDGFILRCRVRESAKKVPYEYTFKVK